MSIKRTIAASALFLLLAGSAQDAFAQKGKKRGQTTEQTASDSTVSLMVCGSPEFNDSTRALVKRLQAEGYQHLEISSVDPRKADEDIMGRFSDWPQITQNYGPYRIMGYTDINAGDAHYATLVLIQLQNGMIMTIGERYNQGKKDPVPLMPPSGQKPERYIDALGATIRSIPGYKPVQTQAPSENPPAPPVQ
jgi:glutaredoxin-related protein